MVARLKNPGWRRTGPWHESLRGRPSLLSDGGDRRQAKLVVTTGQRVPLPGRALATPRVTAPQRPRCSKHSRRLEMTADRRVAGQTPAPSPKRRPTPSKPSLLTITPRHSPCWGPLGLLAPARKSPSQLASDWEGPPAARRTLDLNSCLSQNGLLISVPSPPERPTPRHLRPGRLRL